MQACVHMNFVAQIHRDIEAGSYFLHARKACEIVESQEILVNS